MGQPRPTSLAYRRAGVTVIPGEDRFTSSLAQGSVPAPRQRNVVKGCNARFGDLFLSGADRGNCGITDNVDNLSDQTFRQIMNDPRQWLS